MTNNKSINRKVPEPAEKIRRGKLTERASSFHGRASAVTQPLIRPRTTPDLFSVTGRPVGGDRPLPKLMKLLLNVTVQRSVGAVQVLMSPESTVGDLIEAALKQYAKEGRRPILPSTDASCYGLHYSQFSLEGLGREEKLITLGSRNFFLCPIKSAPNSNDIGGAVTASSSSCSKQAEKPTKIGFPWLKSLLF